MPRLSRSITHALSLSLTSARALSSLSLYLALQPHKKSMTAVALDSEQQTVGSNDVVRVIDGQYKGKTGTVRHIFRAFLFLYSPAMMTHAGTFVVRSRSTFSKVSSLFIVPTEFSTALTFENFHQASHAHGPK